MRYVLSLTPYCVNICTRPLFAVHLLLSRGPKLFFFPPPPPSLFLSFSTSSFFFQFQSKIYRLASPTMADRPDLTPPLTIRPVMSCLAFETSIANVLSYFWAISLPLASPSTHTRLIMGPHCADKRKYQYNGGRKTYLHIRRCS